MLYESQLTDSEVESIEIERISQWTVSEVESIEIERDLNEMHLDELYFPIP